MVCGPSRLMLSMVIGEICTAAVASFPSTTAFTVTSPAASAVISPEPVIVAKDSSEDENTGVSSVFSVLTSLPRSKVSPTFKEYEVLLKLMDTGISSFIQPKRR